MLWDEVKGLRVEDEGTEARVLSLFRGGAGAWLETDSDRDREGG